MYRFCVLSGMNSVFEMKSYTVLAKRSTMSCDWLYAGKKCTEILSLLHDSKTAGHPGMSQMKLTVSSRLKKL